MMVLEKSVLLSGFDVHDLLAIIVAAMRANMMRTDHSATVAAFN